MRRRYVAGMREVAKNASRGKLKVLIVAPDIEDMEADGAN